MPSTKIIVRNDGPLRVEGGNRAGGYARASRTASRDAPPSRSAVAGTRRTNPFATALTRRPDFRTSSRLGSFPHPNLKSNHPARE